MSTAAPFLFGKLPTHGDFVARGLSDAVRTALDCWLSASLAAAQAQAGTGFAARYQQAPPWRFHLAAGPGGLVCPAGAIALSLDRAGRHFPFLLGYQHAQAAACEVAEALIYAAFRDRLDADALLRRAQAALAAAQMSRPGPMGWWPADDLARRIEEACPPDLVARMIACSEEPRR